MTTTKRKHRLSGRWSPLGNGTRTYVQRCLANGCVKHGKFVNLDFTDLDTVQLKTGGFRLVRVPGKAFAEIMAAFNVWEQAVWVAAIEIAAQVLGDLEDDLFYGEWSDAILFHEYKDSRNAQ